MKKFFEFGGVAAGVLLVAFGIAAIVLGVNGRNTVSTELKQQQIVGTPDMTPAGIKAEAAKAGLKNVNLPTCTVANQAVNSGTRARCFAQYMRIHALGASSGLTYAQMGRYQAKPDAPIKATDFNGGTNVNTYAVVNTATGQPADNGVRNVWVTETALTSALNLAYTASQISLFGIVVGIALLLTGIGFLILAFSVFGRTPKEVTSPASAVVPAAG